MTQLFVSGLAELGVLLQGVFWKKAWGGLL